MWSTFGLREERLSDTTYPSWVPDFMQAQQEAPNMHREIQGKKGRTAPFLRRWEEPPLARVSNDLKTLSLWARSTGTCKIAFNFESQASKVLKQIEGVLRTPLSNLPGSSLGKKIRKPKNLHTRLAYAL
jgi:hypothetical protein